MSAAELAERFLPSVARARQEGVACWVEQPGGSLDLFTLEPQETHELAAVIVTGRALRRTSFAKVEELDTPRLERLRTAAVASSEGYEERAHSVLEPDVPVERQRCTTCAVFEPGWTMCTLCLGAGCRTCGAGRVACTTCGGTGETWRAGVRYVTDNVLALRSVVCPAMPVRLRDEVKATLAQLGALPACLVTDLESEQRGAAYRSRLGEASFAGFRFGSAAPRAKKHAARIDTLPSVVKSEAVFYAWPLLCLVYALDSAIWDLALFIDPEAGLMVRGVER